jgi:hypothetical protein
MIAGRVTGGLARSPPRRGNRRAADAAADKIDDAATGRQGCMPGRRARGPAVERHRERRRVAHATCARQQCLAHVRRPEPTRTGRRRHGASRADRRLERGARDRGDQAPAGTDADYFLLRFAKELNASLVSNDRFRDRSRQFAEVRRQIIRYMILADEVVFERRTSRRKTP